MGPARDRWLGALCFLPDNPTEMLNYQKNQSAKSLSPEELRNYSRGRKNYQRTEYDDYYCEEWEENGKAIQQIINKKNNSKFDIFDWIAGIIVNSQKFYTKYKKIIFIVIPILVIAGYFLYQHQVDVNYCKDKCDYRQSGDFWMYRSKYFETQKQCADYCLRNK